MLDSILVAASGLNTHQKGLKVISDNVANMNTPGFKGSNAQFTDVFLHESQGAATGSGVNLLPPSVNFSAGEIRSTGRALDLALDGPGFFVLSDKKGQQLFSKSGRFEFNPDSTLVTVDGGLTVMAGAPGESAASLKPFNIAGLRNSEFKPSQSVVFNGNLSSTAGSASTTGPDHTIKDIVIYDSLGAAHTVVAEFTVRRETPTGETTPSLVPGTWDVAIKEGSTNLGSGVFKFTNGVPDPTSDRFTVSLTAIDGKANSVTFSLNAKTTSFSSGTTSDLAKESSDGQAHGTISQTAFDDKGELTITYTNGQTAKGPRIAAVEFSDTNDLHRATGANFTYVGAADLTVVELGKSSSLVGNSLELSNTDLTDQFSNMILIQRGFQASSQVLSTASEMIQSLFDIKARR